MMFENLQRREIVGKITDMKSMVLFRELAFKSEGGRGNPLTANAWNAYIAFPPGITGYTFLRKRELARCSSSPYPSPASCASFIRTSPDP